MGKLRQEEHCESEASLGYCGEPLRLLQSLGHLRTLVDVICLVQTNSGTQLYNYDLAQINMHVLVMALCKNVNIRYQPV